MAKAETKQYSKVGNKKYLLIRYGKMNNLGFFEHRNIKVPRVPAKVIVKTGRGLELAQFVGQAAMSKSGHFKLSDKQIKKYFIDSDIDFNSKPSGKIIRIATAEDFGEQRHLDRIAVGEMQFCIELVKEMNLSMKVVAVDHIFGGERIIFYFMSESRVDFRELVKKLAQEYQSRIEMRQIGSRDEAKLLGDVESCGQQCCCKRFLQVLQPVNMRMAKMQKATLDPSKISGYCGRLKCCLRYEDETYTRLKKNLPYKNTPVKTRYGLGTVIDSQILTQLVVVAFEGGKKLVLGLEEIEIVHQPQKSRNQTKQITDNKNEQDTPEPEDNDTDRLQDTETNSKGEINENSDNQ